MNVIEMAKNWANLVSLSTTGKIFYLTWAFGIPMMKSIEISSHFYYVIGKS